MVIIYKLFSETCESFYVGSTNRTLKQRLAKHKNKSHEAPNRKVYKCILGNGGFKEWKIEPLEIFETDNAIERRIREQHYITELKPDLNTLLAINIG